MSYQPYKWINDESELSAEHMNHIEEGIVNSQNIELIALNEQAPSECKKDDKYYNITDKLIYTAIEDNTWDENGKTPLQGVFYLLLSEQSSYYFDGTTMISVGGGTEDILIQEEEPTTEDWKIWINPNEPLNNVGSEVVNSLDGNEDDKAPSVRTINNKFGKILWSGSFTSGSIDVPNFSKYNFICVNVNGCFCFGSKEYGVGGVGQYGSYDIVLFAYRIAHDGDKVSINEFDKGGMAGSTQQPILEIYGLF